MVRVAIINHETHELFIEDIPDKELELYGGEEEAYIKDNYNLEGNWSWDFINYISFYSNECPDGMEVEPTDLL